MARQVLLTTTPLDTGRDMINDMSEELYAFASDTISAGWTEFSVGATIEARIALADAACVSQGKSLLHIPLSMIPYDISLCPPTAGVRRVREGGNSTVFDALAYGADFDGTRDNWENLKALADALRFAGGEAYLPGGTCITSGSVYWPQGSIIRGAGRGVTIVKRASGSITNGIPNNTADIFRAGSADLVQYTVASHGSKISVYDMTIDGNATGNPGVTNVNLSCHGIRFHFVDDVHLSQVEVQQCLESGIYLWGCRRTSNTAVSCHHNGLISVASSRNGYAITGPQDDATDRGAQDDHVFSICESYNNTDEGISVGRNGRVTVQGCFIHDNGDMGIEGDTGTATSDTTNVPAGWIIKGNHIYSNGTHGIGLGNSNVQRVVITSNIIEDHPGKGIDAAFTSGSLVVIGKNIIRNWGTASAASHGISVGAVDRVSLQGNVLEGGSGTLSTGVVLSSVAGAPARHVNIDHNQIINAGGGGMSIAGAVTGSIDHNIVSGTVSAFTEGILVTAAANAVDQLEISHNYVTGCISNGIRIRTNGTANATNVRLRSNTSVGNQYGFAFGEAGGGTILRLVMEDNDLWGNSSGAINGLTAGMIGRRRDNQLGFPSSTNLLRGTVALVNGTVTVSNTEVQTGDTIMLTRLIGAGTTRGILTVGTIINATSFVIRSEDLTGTLSSDDDSTVFYEIVH